MDLNDVYIEKSSGGLGRRLPDSRMISGLVTTGEEVAGADNLKNDQIYELNSPAAAEAIGIDKAYDIANKTLLFHHIDAFFFRNPSATLHLLVAARTKTLIDLADKDQAYAAKLLREVETIEQLGISRNPATDYVPGITDFDADVKAAIPLAQALAAAEFLKYRHVDIIIEGRGLGEVADSADLSTEAAEDVSVITLADNDISSKDATYINYAAIGDVLGMVSLAERSQNIGERIDQFDLTDVATGRFLVPGLSSGKKLTEYSEADLKTLNGKRHIFGHRVAGLPGTYLNDSFTCTSADSDYGHIENNRVIKQAFRLARRAILPRVNSRLPIDPDSGLLESATRISIQNTIVSAIESMGNDISGGVEAYIDPNQNLLATSNLKILLTFVPISIGRKITISIGFKNPLSNG